MIHIKQYVVIGRRNSAMLMQYGTLESFLHPVRGCRWSVPHTMIYAKNMHGAHCYHIPTRRRMQRILERELRSGIYTKKFFQQIHHRWNRVVENIKCFADKDFHKEQLSKFHHYYDIFYEIYIATLFPMMMAIYSSDLQDFFERELLKVMPEGQSNRRNIIAHAAFLLMPQKLTFVQQEEQILFTVQQEFESTCRGRRISKQSFVSFCARPYIRRQLQKLAHNYGWFHMEYVGEPWTVEIYIKHLWHRIQTERHTFSPTKNAISPRERVRIAHHQQTLFFKEYPNSQLLKRVAYVLQEFALVLDYSKAELIHGIYLARPMLEELARRLNIGSWILVRNLFPREAHAAIARGYLTAQNRVNIRIRAKEYTLWLKDGRIYVYHGREATRMKNRLLYEPRTIGIKEFHGLIAMTGKVRGVAKVVTSAKALSKMHRGDILIVDEITTELTSVVKKAAAIVANGGGIMSHTAIVAREFQTPCIVGTKIATRVLKDGDKVEVDANRGIVKKLN